MEFIGMLEEVVTVSAVLFEGPAGVVAVGSLADHEVEDIDCGGMGCMLLSVAA